MKWLKYNLDIDQSKWNMFISWSKEYFTHRASSLDRIKVYKHNDQLWIKYRSEKSLENIKRYWIKSFPEFSEIVSTEYFYSLENLKWFNKEFEDTQIKPAWITSIWSYDFGCILCETKSDDLKKWFVETYGQNWNCIKKITAQELNWVSMVAKNVINIVDHVLVFEFNNASDQLLFRMAWSSKKDGYYGTNTKRFE
jgi:hypothetical protein